MQSRLSILYDNLVLERAVKVDGYPVTKVIDVSITIYVLIDDDKCIDGANTIKKIETN